MKLLNSFVNIEKRVAKISPFPVNTPCRFTAEVVLDRANWSVPAYLITPIYLEADRLLFVWVGPNEFSPHPLGDESPTPLGPEKNFSLARKKKFFIMVLNDLAPVQYEGFHHFSPVRTGTRRACRLIPPYIPESEGSEIGHIADSPYRGKILSGQEHAAWRALLPPNLYHRVEFLLDVFIKQIQITSNGGL